MRSVEWLFFLSFLPAFFSPFFSLFKQQIWKYATALLPLFTGLLHLILEGWRVQMLPLYLLAVLFSFALLKGRGRPPRKRSLLVGGGAALLYVAGGLLSAWALPVVRLPAPTGPYLVGVVDRELTDNARKRRLMVSVWYPTVQSGVRAPLIPESHLVGQGLAVSFGVPMAAPLFQHFQYFKSMASKDVTVADEEAPFPVLVFSHGLVGIRQQNSALFQELASWGYVVIALDHTDAAAVTVFPDGEVRLFNLQRFGIAPSDVERSTERLLPVWVADQRFIYDMLEQWEKHDPLLAGKLDPHKIASFGHSFGGVTSLEVCRVDPRCRAAVNLDGGLGAGGSKAALRPFMLMSATESNQFLYAIERWQQLVTEAKAPAYWLELPGSNHYSFTILPLISPLISPQSFGIQAGLRTVAKYTRAFFDLYLRGIQTNLLGSSSGETDVLWRTE
jgi:predicted dienelactone hydrolase